MTQEQKHTPEPWYEAGGIIFYHKGERLLSDSLIAKFFASPRYGLNVKTSYANAARVVACVNACAGMADPAAEIAALRARVAELEKEAQPCTCTPDETTGATQFPGEVFKCNICGKETKL